MHRKHQRQDKILALLRSQPDPLDLVLREPFLGAVVELGRARALVRRHFLRVLQSAAGFKIGGDAGRAEADCQLS